jgi:hypothetical protein
MEAGNSQIEDEAEPDDYSGAVSEDNEPFVETETSGSLPSLNELESRAEKKERQRDERERRTGDWQIMSVPATALTSLFLNEQTEAAPGGTESGGANLAGAGSGESPVVSSGSQYDTGPQRVYETEVTSKAAESSPAPPGVAGQSKQGTSGGQTPVNESRKNKRKRSRH